MNYFLIIIVTFIFAFGIPLQAIIRPNDTSFSFDSLIQIFNNAYWPIYGQINLLEDLKFGNCSIEKSIIECSSEKASKIFSYGLLMIYMIIASVLLLNLLIAMFR